MTDYVAMIVFPQNSTTYEAMSRLRSTGADGIASAAIVERDDSGRLYVPEGNDNVVGTGTGVGSVVGMLVGVLGGPIGMLLGMAGGASVGALYDADRIDTSDAVIDRFSRLVPAGGNAIVVQMNDAGATVVDDIAQEFGGTVTKTELDEVLDEMEQQQEAAEQAAAAARKAMRENKRSEIEHKWQERMDKLRDKFKR